MAGPAIAKPEADRREYSFLQLENGLRAVLGSDPTCDKSGAALCVNVGMCHERKDMPGLAHFLEHMLFTGTRKYPSEGEYHEFMQQNGGVSNAYTTCFFTNYMFEVKPEALEPALDRFSRFFTEPLLTRSCTEREINAVDSEFQGGSTQPWWRYVGIMNMSANPEHPFHVACGNVKVLRDEPKERGVDLYEEMVKLYNACYSANGMTLCVLGRESLPELEALVRASFAGVADKGLDLAMGDRISAQPPFLPDDWNRLLLMSPVPDIKELSFSWVIPYQGPRWRSKPAQCLSHLLGHEGLGSVTSVLKRKGLISACSAGDGAWLEGAFSLVTVTFELTERGQEGLAEVGEHLFAYLGMLQRRPLDRRIVEELAQIRRVRFRFAEDRGPFSLCPSVAQSLQHHPPSEVLAAGSLLYEVDPDSIAEVVSLLTTGSVRVCHQAKSVAEHCTERDTSYGSPMAFLPLEPEWRRRWSAAAADAGAAEALGLHLPRPNPFIPTDLGLRPAPEEPRAKPVEIPGPPGMRLFHRQDTTFKQPKIHAQFLIYSPLLARDVVSYTEVELWCLCVEESLSEFSYDAQMAGVGYGLGLSSGALALSFGGFGDKLSVLMKAVARKMRSMQEVPEEVHSIVAGAYSDDLLNAALHSPPYSQCGSACSELFSRGLGFPARLRHEALRSSVTREGLAGLAGRLLGECHVEALVVGNASAGDAQSLASDLATELGLNQGLAALPERAEAQLPPGRTLWRLKGSSTAEPNNAVMLRVQLPGSVETDMMLGLLSRVLGPKFFDILRTQQQLGYVVQLGASSSWKFSYLVAIVQTEYPPEHVRSQITAFLSSHLAFVESGLSQEEFDACKAGFLSELRAKPKGLSEELGRYQRAFGDRSFDFERRQRAVQFLESGASSLAALRDFLRGAVRTAPWLFVQVHKAAQQPDKEPPSGVVPAPEELQRTWEGREQAAADFLPQAAWQPLPSAAHGLAARL